MDVEMEPREPRENKEVSFLMNKHFFFSKEKNKHTHTKKTGFKSTVIKWVSAFKLLGNEEWGNEEEKTARCFTTPLGVKHLVKQIVNFRTHCSSHFELWYATPNQHWSKHCLSAWNYFHNFLTMLRYQLPVFPHETACSYLQLIKTSSNILYQEKQMASTLFLFIRKSKCNSESVSIGLLTQTSQKSALGDPRATGHR